MAGIPFHPKFPKKYKVAEEKDKGDRIGLDNNLFSTHNNMSYASNISI